MLEQKIIDTYSLIQPSDILIERIIKFYKSQNLNIQMTGIWNGLIDGNFKDIHNILLTGDIKQVRKAFDEIYSTPTLWGIDWYKTHEMISEYPQVLQKAFSNLGKDLQIEIFNPITEKSIQEIEAKTQFKLDFPLYPERPIITLYGRNIPVRYVTCIQVVERLKNYIKEQPTEVLEIGAGTGYITSIITNMYPNVKYHIIDLPLVSVIHAYIHCTMFGENKIWFVGEEDKANKSLFFYSPSNYENLYNSKIDFAINHNSFPEIHTETQQAYLDLLKQTLNKNGFFFSVNWEPSVLEDQYPTANACVDHGGFERIYRDIFKGDCEWHYKLENYYPYLEEVFKLKPEQ